jgi:3,2-trans-enoyl-CoA isomerase
VLQIISHGDIVELQLDRPPANALNHALLRRLLDAMNEITAGGSKGLILSGQQGMFCAGVDVPELIGMDRRAILEFWGLLFDSSKALLTSPVPVVAMLEGHSPAGGAVLAAHCDYRIAADGPFKIGFNEVQVGLPLTGTILYVFENLVGPRMARQLAMQGKMLTMPEARDVGLVDELLAPATVRDRTLEYLESLLSLPPMAMNHTRLAGKARLINAARNANDVEQLTDTWFGAETQAAMQALVERLKDN